jgi:hypothetical protein
MAVALSGGAERERVPSGPVGKFLLRPQPWDRVAESGERHRLNHESAPAIDHNSYGRQYGQVLVLAFGPKAD